MADEAEDLRGLPSQEDTAAAPDPDGAMPAPDGHDAIAEDAGPLPVDALARDLGWKPESEWKGDKTKWAPADEFLRQRVAKADRLSDEVKGMNSRLDQLARTSAAIAEKNIREERERLTREFDAAVRAGDAKAAYQASQQLGQAQAGPIQEPSSGRADFAARNTWVTTDPDAASFAFAVVQRRLDAGEDLSEAEQFRIAEEAVRKRFPEHFQAVETPKRGHQPHTHSTGSRASQTTSRAKGAADLPREARAAGEDFVRRGRVGSLEDYAKAYFEEND